MKKKMKSETATNTVSREDCLELSLAASEVARIEAQLTALQTQHQLLRPMLEPAKAKREQLEQAIKATYSIGDSDTLNVETGVITRGPKPEVEVADDPTE